MRVTDVVPLDDHILFVESADGTTGLFDLKPYLAGEVFGPLRDYAEFSAVNNGGYSLEWACGADLSADTIETHFKSATPEIAQQARQCRPKTAYRGQT